MARLVWEKVSERFYEDGLDRGVLYVGDEAGAAWTGLISVKESPSSSGTTSHYIDGVKYADRAALESFEATVEAYTYPEAFERCVGTIMLGNGLFATRQRPRSFGLSYRTLIGSAAQELGHAYKLHLVYNAIAVPSEIERRTRSDSNNNLNFSWTITTRPSVLDFQPTAHFVIDSRDTPEGLLRYIEGILYGDDANESRMPSAAELAFLFTTYNTSVYDAGGPDDVVYYTYDGGFPASMDYNTVIDGGELTIFRENLVPNSVPNSTVGWSGAYGTGGAGALSYSATGGPSEGYVRRAWTTAPTAQNYSFFIEGRASGALPISVKPGDVLSGSFHVRSSWAPSMRSTIFFYDAAGVGVGTPQNGAAVTLTPNEWTKFTINGIVVPEGATNIVIGAFVYLAGALPAVGSTLDAAQALLEVSSEVGEHFHGDTVDSEDVYYGWSGIAHRSKAVAYRFDGGTP